MKIKIVASQEEIGRRVSSIEEITIADPGVIDAVLAGIKAASPIAALDAAREIVISLDG